MAQAAAARLVSAPTTAEAPAATKVVVEFRGSGEVPWQLVPVKAYAEQHERLRAGEAMARGLRNAGYTARVVEHPEPVAAPKPPLTVLYIGGWGRCGSTLLDMLLGQVNGVVSVGEIRELWLRGCVENRPCGCGEAFADCPFWGRVGEIAYGGWDKLDIDRLLATRYSLDRAWAVPRLLKRSSEADRSVATYCDALARLYPAIQQASGAQVVVDSSKIASHALLLRRTAGIDLRIVHLVRDSRGVAHSVQKHVRKPIDETHSTWLPRHGPMTASGRYNLYNGMAGALQASGSAFTRLRYEDLVDDPAGEITKLLAFAGLAAVDLEFLDGDVATLQGNHMVDGNPVRFNTGAVTLSRDEQWRKSLSALDRRIVTALTFPALVAYGYTRDSSTRPVAVQPATSARPLAPVRAHRF